jgi:hypothetical protein
MDRSEGDDGNNSVSGSGDKEIRKETELDFYDEEEGILEGEKEAAITTSKEGNNKEKEKNVINDDVISDEKMNFLIGANEDSFAYSSLNLLEGRFIKKLDGLGDEKIPPDTLESLLSQRLGKTCCKCRFVK